MAPTFTPEQLAHMARQFDKRNQKWHAEWLDGNASERSARRIKQLKNGPKCSMAAWKSPNWRRCAASSAVTDFKAASRLPRSPAPPARHPADLRDRFKAAAWPAANAQMHALYARSMNSPDPTYQRYLAHITQETCKALPSCTTASPRPSAKTPWTPSKLGNRCARAGRSRALSC
jgi:hypothetical protein